MQQYKVKSIKISRMVLKQGLSAELFGEIFKKLDPDTEIVSFGEDISRACSYIHVTNKKYGKCDGGAYIPDEIEIKFNQYPDGSVHISRIDEGINNPSVTIPSGFQFTAPKSGTYKVEWNPGFYVDPAMTPKRKGYTKYADDNKCTCGIEKLGGGLHSEWCDKHE